MLTLWSIVDTCCLHLSYPRSHWYGTPFPLVSKMFHFGFLESPPSTYFFKDPMWKWHLQLFSFSALLTRVFLIPLVCSLSSCQQPFHDSAPSPLLLLCALCSWQSSALGSLCPEGFATNEGWAPGDTALCFIFGPSFPQGVLTGIVTSPIGRPCCSDSPCQTDLSGAFSLLCLWSLFPVPSKTCQSISQICIICDQVQVLLPRVSRPDAGLIRHLFQYLQICHGCPRVLQNPLTVLKWVCIPKNGTASHWSY